MIMSDVEILGRTKALNLFFSKGDTRFEQLHWLSMELATLFDDLSETVEKVLREQEDLLEEEPEIKAL